MKIKKNTNIKKKKELKKSGEPNSMPFDIVRWDHLRSTHWGSFAVRDHLLSTLGSFPVWGSFAELYTSQLIIIILLGNQKFGIINRVDKCKLTTVQGF